MIKVKQLLVGMVYEKKSYINTSRTVKLEGGYKDFKKIRDSYITILKNKSQLISNILLVEYDYFSNSFCVWKQAPQAILDNLDMCERDQDGNPYPSQKILYERYTYVEDKKKGNK